MPFKVLGSILVFTACSLIGYVLSKECAIRINDLRELQSILHVLENEIYYLSNTLSDAFGKISKSSDDSISLFFSETIKYLKAGEYTAFEAWEKAIEENIKKTSLNKEDEGIIIEFGRLLGNSDIDGQLKNIELTLGQLKMQEKKAEEFRQKNENMYKSLGVLIGIAIVVMLL